MPAQTARTTRKEPPTVDRIREDIDKGSTFEKVPYPDPAAAPMGTDDEAAGNTPSRMERTIEAEARHDPVPVERKRQAPVALYALLIMVAVVMVIAVALLNYR
jgi:hypothetical protein